MRWANGTAAAVVAAVVVLAPATTAAATVAQGPVPATAPADACHDQPNPYAMTAKSARLHSRPSSSAPTLGVLYKNHGFKYHKDTKNWLLVTDKKTGVKGWASKRLFSVKMCLN